VLLAALAAAAVTVGLVKLTSRGETTAAQAASAPKPRAGAPPLALDLGVRTDREARALRQAQSLYAAKRYADAARIFLRYGSVEAQVGAALASWTRDRSSAWAHLQAIAREHPRSALVQFHVGGALFYLSRPADAERAWRKALAAEPDTQSAIDAETFLHPALAPGRPLFVPSFQAPARLSKLSAPAQVAALERAARRPDVHAKILYGVALQRLGHFLSAEQQFAAAARLAPDDPEALAAADVGRFTKTSPQAAFSRLGPLSRRFPKAQTVRFHLGLMLIWLGRQGLPQARRELALARAQAPRSQLGREANLFLSRLGSR
jgi:tetratricopeptide (TPR) repeat protein